MNATSLSTLTPSRHWHTWFEDHGHWVVCKTENRFSAMPIDQAHEQNNAVIKCSGGALGLTENPSAFRKWVITGPEQARLIVEFKKQYLREIQDKHLHHEEGLAAQKNFKRQVLDLLQAVNEFGNPFLEDSPELLTLDTRNVMDESVIETVCTVESLGKEQYDKYCESVILKCERSIHETISKNNLALFKWPKPKAKSKQAKAVAVLKDDVALFFQIVYCGKKQKM